MDVTDIDLAMKLGTGLEPGPMAWVDARGVVTVVRDLEALGTLGSRFAVPESLKRAVAEGRTGQGAPGTSAGGAAMHC